MRTAESCGLSNERALIKAGYKVITAEDGESALQRAKEQQPDLILLDLLLPKVSGLEVLTRLKHNRPPREFPSWPSADSPRKTAKD